MVVLLACGSGGAPKTRDAGEVGREAKPVTTTVRPDAGDPSVTNPQDHARPDADAADVAESRHAVVFADRIRHVYVLLVNEAGLRRVSSTRGPSRSEVAESPASPAADGLPMALAAPTRADLQGLVRAAFPGRHDEEEVRALLTFIGRDPSRGEAGRLSGDETQRRAVLGREMSDLLGISIDLVSRLDVIDRGMLADPLLTRGVSPADRATLETRKWALVIRGEYRPRFIVRGLRLLQTIALLYAQRTDALIFDADTAETWAPAGFAQRRLRAHRINMAEQISVVPFTDPSHPAGAVRLTTRGMRRFGAPDLELDGLDGDPVVLQHATRLLTGLAFVTMQYAELDEDGYASQAPDVVELQRDHIVAAFGDDGRALPVCAACPGDLELHLVEREAQAHDPPEHVVARVVAPRPVSDSADYAHPTWVRAALARFFAVRSP